MARAIPSFDITSRLVSRALGLAPESLHAALRPALASDLPDILALRQRTRWNDAAYVAWRYAPGAPGSAGATLWVLRDGEKLHAMVGTEQVSLRIDNDRFEGHLVMDLVVDPACADLGVGTWINQALFERTDFTLAVGANPNSMGLVKGLFHALPDRSIWLLPLVFGNLLGSRISNPALARIAGKLADLAWPVWRRLRRPRLARGIELKPIAQFDDGLLGSLQSAPRARAEVLRTARRMNWRLLENPRARYEVIGAFRGPRCVGYVAFRVVPGSTGLPAMHMIDWLTTGDDADAVLTLLLSAVIHRARGAHCASVQTLVLDRGDEVVLSRNGFLRGRPADYLVAGIHSKDPGLVQRATGADWRITDLTFDDDGCF